MSIRLTSWKAASLDTKRHVVQFKAGIEEYRVNRMAFASGSRIRPPMKPA